MHTLVAIALAPVVAAEKSKTPFYVAGGLLVAWALIVSMVLGMRKPDFPGSLGGQRIVSAITAVLVLAAVSTAVITSGGEEKKAEAETSTTVAPQATAPGTTPAESPTPTAEAGKTPAPAATGTTKKAAPAPAPAVTKLSLEANPGGQLAYNTQKLQAKAGAVTITFTNGSPVEHDVTIAQGSTTLGATPVFTGGAKSVTVQLKPGTYTFYCSVPGHRQAGMEGTLTVQ